MLSARISTYTNTLILPKPKLYSRSFSDHFSWSGPAPTEVGADVDYAAEVGDDCDCCWDARMPGRARWRHNLRKVILLHIHLYSMLTHRLSWRSLSLVDGRSRVRYPGTFFLLLRLIAWMVAVVGGTGCPKRRRLFKFTSVQGDYLGGENNSEKKLMLKIIIYRGPASARGGRSGPGRAGPATYQIRTLPAASCRASTKKKNAFCTDFHKPFH